MVMRMLRLRPFKKCDENTVFSWITEQKGFYQWFANRADSVWNEACDTENEIDYSCLFGDDTGYDLVAFDETGICGFVSMHFPDMAAQRLSLDFVTVRPDKRGKGYGKKLMSLVIRYAQDLLLAKEIYVDLFRENEAAYYCFSASGFQEKKADEKNVSIFGALHKSLEMEYYTGAGQAGQQIETTENFVDEEYILREIIDKNALKYAFQPIVEAATGEIYGYEALMRADRGALISPEVILKNAKAMNSLYTIEKHTFTNVLSCVSRKREQFGSRKIFINSIPGCQLTEEDYGALAEEHGELFRQVVVEITEETDINDMELEVLVERGRKEGFGIAIDDYGTGYSNTASLLRCVPNCIKIDRLLISGIHEEPKKQHFVKSIVEFAHNNGILSLAEGVETVSELKAVIEMGIDLIQGFYTARPSFSILEEIEPQIRNAILNVNVKGQTQTTRRVYNVDGEKELPLMRLTLEKYTGILLGQREFTLVGNINYTAAMSIKIKDNCDCRLTIRNVCMESFLELPCIEIGKNSHLTLVLEGENRIRKVGICVPEGSSLVVEGDGDLFLRVQGINSYGIGNGWDAGVGSITLNTNGKVGVLVEAERGVGIGGGEYRNGSGVKISSGTVSLEPASNEVICIGCVNGDIPIDIQKCSLEMIIRSDKGIGIGSEFGNQKISITSAKVDISGSGGTLCCIGSSKVNGGEIQIENSGISMEMNGRHMIMIGNGGGGPKISFKNSGIRIKAEGHQVLGIGADDKSAVINAYHSDIDITIRSENNMLLGALEENVLIDGGRQRMTANA